MIYVKVIGGLGNQLFQYAFARGLARRLGCGFKLDVTGFSRYYRLHRFTLPELGYTFDGLAAETARRFHRGTGPGIHLFTLWQRLKPPALRYFFRERTIFRFDPSLLNPPKFPCYYDGYWQNEGYFTNVADELRAEFRLNLPLTDDDRRFADEIRSHTGVSVHFRRGDYVTDPKTRKFLGVCSPEYVQRGVDLIRQKVANPHLFVFSDDPAWVREHFSPGLPLTVVSDRPNARGSVDLYLMSLCRHHIIANSTFSWWGAWLNPDPAKIVIGPQNWAHGFPSTSLGILPPGWIAL
jgi:hypothetical protein